MMDIVKRAYLQTKEEMRLDVGTFLFHDRVYAEIVRLINVRAYSGRDWPRELGPMPDSLRKK